MPMTIEEKKALLQEYRKLDGRINRALAEKRRWEELAVRTSPVYSDMPRGGGNGDRLTEAVQRIIDLEAEIDRDIDRLVDLRRQIEQSIDAVEDTRLRDILRRRYVDGDTLEKMAEDLELSYQWVCVLHGRALEKIDTLDRN
jgi:DNA-directed RNA polymerase specialized sigma subunit